MADKAKGLALLLGMPKGGADSGDDEDAEKVDVGADRKKAAAKALRAALDGGDDDALADAFSEMCEACEGSYKDDSGED
jgi:hypothetical protein